MATLVSFRVPHNSESLLKIKGSGKNYTIQVGKDTFNVDVHGSGTSNVAWFAYRVYANIKDVWRAEKLIKKEFGVDPITKPGVSGDISKLPQSKDVATKKAPKVQGLDMSRWKDGKYQAD